MSSVEHGPVELTPVPLLRMSSVVVRVCGVFWVMLLMTLSLLIRTCSVVGEVGVPSGRARWVHHLRLHATSSSLVRLLLLSFSRCLRPLWISLAAWFASRPGVGSVVDLRTRWTRSVGRAQSSS